MKDLYEIEEKLDHLFERVMKLEQAINGSKRIWPMTIGLWLT